MSRTKKALQLLVGIGFLMALFALAVGEIVPHPEEIQFKLSQTKSLSPFATSSHDYAKSLSNVAKPKEERAGVPNVPDPNKIRQGGDNIGSPAVIPSVPYSISGTTAGYTHDYNEACTYTSTGAPDVVYSYTPGANEVISLSLCTSLYDTKMYIYENAYTPGAPYACNDDACGDDGYKSKLDGIALTGGNTYYIVIDGYSSSDYGTYYLDITLFEECVVECPPGASMEIEACGDDANGGCNMATPTWNPVACGETVCGTIWAAGGTRDTDWYELTLTEAKTVTWTATGEFPLVVGYIAGCPMGAPDCGCIVELDPYMTADPCVEASVTIDLGIGTHWFFVSATVYDGFPCGGTNDYVVSMTCGEAPIGRCCYGDPQSPSCADVNIGECQVLGGSWDGTKTCAEDCPIGQTNDDCVNAIDVPGPYPELVAGTTAASTIDCPGVLDWNAVWYKFDVPYTCANVTMDYCAGGPEVMCLGVVVYAACDDCPNYILYSENLWLDCSGITQPLTKFNMLTGPATYYYPVFMGDLDCIGIESDFAFYLDVQECPPAAPGDDCSDPLAITLPGDIPYLDNNYTCGRVDQYNATCLGYYDGGEDIIYEVTVTAACDVDIKLDPLGSATYTGMLLDDACPPDPTTCLGTSTNSGSGAHTMMNKHLDPGTYYIMVDTWPSPTCIPVFDLSITEAEGPTSGDNCADPIIVKVPADLPYLDASQTNCARVNDYSNTCLGSYDGGEDIIYRLDVTDASIVTITMNPKTTTWTGIAIDEDCPLDIAAGDCIAKVTGSAATPRVITDLPLAPGVYYIMVDTYPSPNCIPDFDLTITAAAAPPELTWDPAAFDFTANFAGDFGDDVLTLGNIGGANLTYGVSVSYAKADKEIDGATITALDDYVPGGTADIEFKIQNASSDAEWIDVATITFPAEVTVVGSTNFVVVGQTRYLQYDGTTGTAVTVAWTNWDGGYGNIYSLEAAVATMTIAVAPGTTGPLTCGWTLSGDDYGSPPHDISGTLAIEQFDPYTSWLTCAGSGSIAPDGEVEVPVNWMSIGMDPGVYTASIVVDHNGKTITEIPVTLTVNAGVAGTFVDPAPAYMYYMFAFDPIHATIDVAVTGNVVSASANGVPAAVSQVGGVATLDVPIAPFLEGYGAPIGTVQKTFSVSGTYDDLSTFVGGGILTVKGKNPISPKSWLIPQDAIILYGDADATGNIDIDDAVTLISFIFMGEFLPGPSLMGDCNCSVFTDIDDVVYIISYIFQGGPFPCQSN